MLSTQVSAHYEIIASVRANFYSGSSNDEVEDSELDSDVDDLDQFPEAEEWLCPAMV